MNDREIRNTSSLVKIIAFIFFAGAITFTLIQKPKLSKEMQAYFRETVFKTYGGPAADSAWNILNTGDGYLISADTASFGAGKKDVYLIKTDIMGGLEWTRTFGDKGDDSGIGLCRANDGGYITAGGTNSWSSSGETDAYAVKTDRDGEHIWDKTYGGNNYDYAYSICSAHGSGYMITGYSSSYTKDPESDVYLLKIDETGKELWHKTFGGVDWDVGYSIAALKDGGYAIAGYTTSFGAGKSDMYIIRTDAKGDCVWAKTYGGLREDRAYSVIQSKDNNLVITAKSGSYVARGFGWDIVLMKVDLDGNSLWTRVFPAADVDAGRPTAETPDGGFIIAGTTRCYGICDLNVLVIKTDAEGNTGWMRIFAGMHDDSSASVCLSNNNDYVICGTTLSYGNGRGDVLLLNVDKNGEKVW